MKSLPKGSTLAKRARDQKPAKGGVTLDVAEKFVLDHHAELAGFDGPEDFATVENAKRGPNHAGLEHHLVVLRAALARELWSREFFVGVSVLDDLVFDAARKGQAGLLANVVEILRAGALHGPGMVVFPVHSFGVRRFGIAGALLGARVRYELPHEGLALVPQTNDWKTTLEILDEVRTDFGVRRSLPEGLLNHWKRSRPVRWLTLNPLVVLRVSSLPGYPYENEALLVQTLQARLGYVSLLAGLQRSNEDESGWGTANVNNWATLDLNHYLVLHASSSREVLSGDCVRIMHRHRASLPELSDLPVQLDMKFWSRRIARSRAAYAAVQNVNSGLLGGMRKAAKHEWKQRVLKKLFEGLSYYRRSLRASVRDWQSIVALATAFEYVLTDNYSKGVGGTLKKRTALLLRDTHARRKRALVQAVSDVYDARSEIVHGGLAEKKYDLLDAREAFAHVFVTLAARLPRLRKQRANPIAWLAERPPTKPPKRRGRQ